jgi:hypothetical protein
MTRPTLHDLIDSALLVTLALFIMYTIDHARPI